MIEDLKHNARNHELALQLTGGRHGDGRTHRTFGGLVGGAGSVALPMIGESLGGPLGGVAGSVLGRAAEHLGNQMDGHGGGSGRGPDNDMSKAQFRPRRGTINLEATQRGNQIANLERQTGSHAHGAGDLANNTYSDGYENHQNNEIERLQTLAQNQQMTQELNQLRSQSRPQRQYRQAYDPYEGY